MIEVSFDNDMKFQKARDTAFQNFMAKQPKTPHFMAYFCDNDFKVGFKQMTDDHIN